jgi:hypothetical protein
LHAEILSRRIAFANQIFMLRQICDGERRDVGVSDCFWGAQAASLLFATACRESPLFVLLMKCIRQGCRMLQAGSLRSPERNRAALTRSRL